MRFGTRILLALSRSVDASDHSVKEWDLENSLSLLEWAFPNVRDDIVGKAVVDFGCGFGFQSVGLARAGARSVLGIENNPDDVARARDLVRSEGLEEQIRFAEAVDVESMANRFDTVISQNSMEHFSDPLGCVLQMKTLVRENGKILVTFGPPWYAPYGSHTHYFTKVPWVNLLFSEKSVMEARACFRQDGATRYEDIEGGLGKLSVSRFERVIAESGLKVQFKQYVGVKRLDFMTRVPVMREMFTNHVNCVLTR